MAFKVLGLVDIDVIVRKNAFIWLDVPDFEGGHQRLYQQVFCGVHINQLIIFENDGQMGLDYNVLEYDGLQN